ncbi:MAG: hypothetical protein QW496_05915 [Desulfurococcaceae archaeon]
MASTTDVNELTQIAEKVSRELFEVRESLKLLKEKRESLQSEIGRLREEKARLLQEIRSIKNQIRALKEERKKLIEEYKKVVENRREEVLQAKVLRDMINSKQAESRELSKEVRLPISSLKQKIEEIEWTIQTNVLTLEEENELVRKLKAYNSLLNKAIVAKKSKEEALELRALYLSTRARIKELSEVISKLGNTINEKSNAVNNLKAQLSNVLSSYMKTKKALEDRKRELEACINEMALLTSRLNALREKYQEILRDIEKAKSLEMLSAKKAKVKHDVERRAKKRLTIEELKIMYGGLEDLEEH